MEAPGLTHPFYEFVVVVFAMVFYWSLVVARATYPRGAMLRSVLAPLAGALPALVFSATVSLAQGRSANVQPTGFPAECRPGEVRVMLLGVYHFASPGADAVKQDIDDVLVPKRQREIEDLVNRLARWAPDQIAVEWPFSFADSTQARYQRYRAGTLAPSRNEVVQIGFRLAARLGHPAVHPIDYQMPIGNDSIGALRARRPELERTGDSLMAVLQATADPHAAWMRRTTITEHLRAANTDEALHRGNSLGMFGSFLQAGEGENYAGPQLLAKWYERNMRMAHHLTRILHPETDRVLVIVGSGHVPPLRNILDEAPQFCPVSPLPYLRR